MDASQHTEAGDDRAILAAAADIDSAAEQLLTGAPGKVAAVEVIDPAAAWAEIPAAVGGVLAMALPELKAVYTPNACHEWGKSMHKVALKRGWSSDGLPPEVGVGLTSAMFVIPTVLAIKARRDAAAAAKRAQQQAEQGGAAGGVLPQNAGGLDGAQAA